jgi:hypothetical protein
MIVSARRGPEITRFAGEEGDDEGEPYMSSSMDYKWVILPSKTVAIPYTSRRKC